MKSHAFSYQGIIISSCIALATLNPLMASQRDLATFTDPSTLKSWKSVNDGVMGGISKGGFKQTEQGTMLFTGELSLENNGGFASIRTQSGDYDLSGLSAIVVKARGDGRTYWVDLRTKGQTGASSYRAYLPTASGEWQETRIPLNDFKPQAFGRELPFKAIDATSVSSLGFTIADKKAGAFSLEIESIKAVGDPTTPTTAPKTEKTVVDVAKAAGTFKTLLAAAKAANLVDVLSGEGPLTVLAPTDEAFAKLPKGTVESLLKPENQEVLVAVLKNHVIAGRVTLAKALELKKGTSLQGSKLTIGFKDGKVRIGDATLLSADIPASNGIIHVIDQVLAPAIPEPTTPTPAKLIALAIERGVPLFNNGDPAACFAVYEVATLALQGMSDVSKKSRENLAKALETARTETSPRDQAWTLRSALDLAFRDLESQQKQTAGPQASACQ